LCEINKGIHIYQSQGHSHLPKPRGRNLDPHTPRGFVLQAVPPPKLYFARAYTIPPATQANGYLKFLCDVYVSATKNRQELRIEGKTMVLFRSQQNKKSRMLLLSGSGSTGGGIFFFF